MANPSKSKLNDEQKAEIVGRYKGDETSVALSDEFGVSPTTILKYIRQAGATDVPAVPLSSIGVNEFATKIRKILWEEDHGKEKKAYNQWKFLVREYRKNGGLDHHQAILEASKEFSCLNEIIAKHNAEADSPSSQSPASSDEIQNEGKELSRCEEFNWAIEAAGKFLRTGERPKSCPSDAAYYLFRQATEDAKDFLAKFAQVEARGNDELEEQRRSARSGKRAIEEINEMLTTLEEESCDESS